MNSQLRPAELAFERKKFHIVIITPDDYIHSAAFAELAETVRYGLLDLGHDASAAHNEFAADATNIIFGAHLIPADMAQNLPAGSIIYNTEQIDHKSPWMKTHLLDLIRRFETWDYSRRNIASLSMLGIAAEVHHVPVGFVPQLSRIKRAVHQDIDVFFYGIINPRRLKIIEALDARGLNVCLAQNSYGEIRDAAIARSKVILNMHFYESQIFEIVRVSYLLANRKAVVSEINQDTEVEAIYREAVAGAQYDRLVETCAALVADDAGRNRLEQRGYEIMSSVREAECLRPALDAMS